MAELEPLLSTEEIIMLQIKFRDQLVTEEWINTPDIYCPKCGTQTVWMNKSGSNYEDNAGDYYLCTTCNHDWHMYPLSGYHGVERTAIRVKEILNERDNNDHSL